MIIWIITGLWVLLGCAEAAHLITIMTDRSLQTYTTLSSVFILAGLFVYIGILSYINNKKKLVLQNSKWSYSPWMFLFAGIACVTAYRLWRGVTPDLQDAIYGIVIGNVDSGSLMQLHPFTGEVTAAAMPFRMQILGLSSLYSALITESQQSQFTIMCKVVPFVIWGFGMMMYWLFAQKLFEHSVKKQWLFMSAVAVLILLTANSPGLIGDRLFHAGFSGETIRAVLLVPYALYAGWQKKWFLSIVAILAEAILVWTTYGVGYCAFIAVIMFVVHFVIDRRMQCET